MDNRKEMNGLYEVGGESDDRYIRGLARLRGSVGKGLWFSSGLEVCLFQGWLDFEMRGFVSYLFTIRCAVGQFRLSRSRFLFLSQADSL